MRSLIWIAVIIVQQHSAVVADTSTININNGKLRLCGEQFYAALSAICHGHYFSTLDYFTKTTKTTFTPKDEESNENDYVPSIARPADAYDHPVAMIRHRRARRTPDYIDWFGTNCFDECCLQPCSYSTLLTYCMYE